MRVYPEKLAGQLKQQLLPVYLITGDEPLLVQECADQVRSAARKQGCTDREIIEAGGAHFNWAEIVNSAGSMSLFGDRKILELRLPGGKPGAEGSKALCEYLGMNCEDVLLIIAGKIDKQSTSSKWYKALDKAGAVITLYPVKTAELPRWLKQRIGAAGMSIDDDALQLLCDRVEGNLLAAVQEVEKLKLLSNDTHLTAEAVTDAVMSNTRYSLFGMADSALAGDASTSLRMLRGLRDEGTEPPVALWALLRELRNLTKLQATLDQGQPLKQFMSANRIWDSRMPLLQGALSRHSQNSLSHLLEQASRVDGSIKGFGDGNPWDHLEKLIIGLCRIR
jgi:DNA polymerase-3 subunit delta